MTKQNGSTPTLPDETIDELYKIPMLRRLDGLKSEFDAGQKMLLDLGAKTNELQNTLLRISGAIQVLEELLAQGAPKENL